MFIFKSLNCPNLKVKKKNLIAPMWKYRVPLDGKKENVFNHL
jgi:hypothetical protein